MATSTLEVLQMEPQSDENRRLIEGAQTQTAAMRRILEDLLDVSRITQNKFNLKKEHIEVQGLINNSVSATQTFMQECGHQLSVSVPPQPVRLFVDPVRFEQIITNLLHNAAKYTDRGGRISLRLSVVGQELDIRVEDNGTGITEDEIGHIFESFRQSRTNQYTHSGLGLGLSITRQLVEMHEGTIRAESEGVGKGSNFIIRFPLSICP
ncbi:HAMP domain-containing histidine kinase [Candidatus Kaiserbacteria bacterium]|nr:HAMP domain-containing histidine kinase [Candidatus Kaiserbacteria bacterium]